MAADPVVALEPALARPHLAQRARRGQRVDDSAQLLGRVLLGAGPAHVVAAARRDEHGARGRELLARDALGAQMMDKVIAREVAEPAGVIHDTLSLGGW